MNRRLGTVAALALVALVAVVAAWAWTRGTDAPRLDSDGSDPRPGAEVSTPAAPAPLAAPDLAQAARVGRATVEGIVRRGGKPAHARVEVRFGHPTSMFFSGHTPERMLQELDGFRPRPRTLAIAETGDDGRFSVDGVAPGRNDVLAVAPDGARGKAVVDVAAEGTRTAVVIELQPTFALRGRARHADGRPFRGRVAITPATASAQPRDDDAVPADAEGRFTVAGLAAVLHHARFLSDDGVLWFRPTPRVPLSGEWDVVVDEGATMLDGRVTDAATDGGIAGARVVVTSVDGPSVVRASAATDADGRFTVPRLRTGSVYAVAGAEGYATSSVERTPEGPLQVRLVRAATLRGTVTRRRDGAPVAGAELRARNLSSARFGTPYGPVLTDASGRYEFTALPPSAIAVSVSAAGLALPAVEPDRSGWTPSSVRLNAGLATTLDLVLDDAVVVRGRVLEADGAPVAQAVVSAAPAGDGGAAAPDATFGDRCWVSAADGSFAIDVFAPGARIVLTAATTADPTDRGSLPVACEPGLAPVEIRLPPRRTVRVRVVRADDRTPLEGVAIEDRSSRRLAETGADGVATVPWSIRVAGPLRARRAGFAGKDLVIRDDTRDVELALAAGRRLEGRVRRADGTAVGGAEVLAGDASGIVGWTVADAEGRFEVTDVDEGECLVTAYLSEGDAVLSGTARGRAGTPIEVTLAETSTAVGTRPIPTAAAPAGRATIEVVATGPDGRRVPVAGVRSSIGGRRGFAWLRGGSARVEAAPAESGFVEASNPRDEFDRPLPFAPGRAEVGPTTERVVVRLGPGSTLEGRVEDPDGAPLSGVEVVAARRPEARDLVAHAGLDGALAGDRTDADGRFRLVSLADEPDLRLVVRPPPTWLVPRPRPVRVGEAGVVVRLARALSPTIRVLDPTGAPVPGVEVRADEEGRREPGSRPGPRTDALGVARLASLDPAAAYRLHAGTEGRPDLAPTDLAGWSPKDETIRLRGVGVLRIDVVDAAGKAIRDTWISFQDHRGSRHAYGSPTGSYRLPSWPLGRTRLHVRADGFTPTDLDVDLAADTPPLRVVLEAGRDLRLRLDVAGPGRPSWVAAYPEGRLDGSFVSEADVGEDGTAVLRGLDPARAFVIWGPPEAGGDRYVLLRVSAIPEGEVRAPVLVGGAIHVRVTVPAGTSHTEVWASSEGRHLQGVAAIEGAFEVRGVPPGTWKIVVRTTSADGESEASVAARPGDVVDVVVPPPE